MLNVESNQLSRLPSPSFTSDAIEVTRSVMKEAGRGLRLKQIHARAGVRFSRKQIESAVQSLIEDGSLTRAGSVGVGYTYWPGNL